MENMLKVYIYQEGEKPIFHEPILEGIYASEGWFMKLLEANKNFITKDPTKAHLFYFPYSSQMLKIQIYVPNSHKRANVIKYMKDYVDMIAAKYSFWNRTNGADHFLAACHDWVTLSIFTHVITIYNHWMHLRAAWILQSSFSLFKSRISLFSGMIICTCQYFQSYLTLLFFCTFILVMQLYLVMENN